MGAPAKSRDTEPQRRTPSGRLLSRPSLPDDTDGLLAALGKADGRDRKPLEEWFERSGPLVIEALVVAGLDRQGARDLLGDMMREAFLAVRSGREVRSELGWLSGLAKRLDEKEDKERSKVLEAPTDGRAGGADPSEEAARADALAHARERIRAAAALLPPPYREVAILQGIEGKTREEIRAALNRIRPATLRQPVSIETVRTYIKVMHEMMAVALAGLDPRNFWPGKYLRKDPWILPPPPPRHAQR